MRAVESMEQTTTVVTITVKMSVLFLPASCIIMVPPMGLLVSYLLSRMGSRMFLEIAFIFLAPTIKRAVTSIVRKETIWDSQHRLTILQSGQAMASSMNHHRIRSFSVMLFTRQRLSVRSMEDIILSIHRKTAMNFAMQQVRTTMDLTILAEPLFPMEMWDTTEEVGKIAPIRRQTTMEVWHA